MTSFLQKAIHEFSGSIHYLLPLLPFVVQFYRDFIATQGQFFHRTKGSTWWFQLWEQREKEKKKRERESKTFFFCSGQKFRSLQLSKIGCNFISYHFIITVFHSINVQLSTPYKLFWGSVIINVLRDPVRKLTHTNDERARLLDHFCVNGT